MGEDWVIENRRKGFSTSDEILAEEIYDLLSYGGLTPEIVEYIMALLLLSKECQLIKLFKRLENFYFNWCQGEYINASLKNIPLNQMQKFKSQEISLGVREVDIYAGLNVMILLLSLNRYAQSKDELKDKIAFYPCGKKDTENFDSEQLLRIINYSDSVSLNTFRDTLHSFLSGIDLSGADLRDANLSGADFANVNFTSANFWNVNFTLSNFSNVNFTDAYLKNANFTLSNFSNINFIGADLENANFAPSNFSNVNFIDTNLTSVNFTRVAFTGVNFSGANLTSANFTNAASRDVNFSGANLTSANFTSFASTGVNFTNANLTGTNLINVNFAEIDFTDAKLKGANLTNANLVNVKLVNTNFSGTFPSPIIKETSTLPDNDVEDG